MYAKLFIPAANKNFWLRWTGYTVLAIAISIVILMAFLGRVINNWPIAAFGATVGCLFGLTTGFAQTFLLKAYLRSSWRWLIASVVGWSVFWSLNMVGVFGRGHGVEEKIFEGLWHGVVFGTMLGLLQATVLPNKKAAALWIMASVVFWPLCAATADGIKAALGTNGPIEFIIALPMAALLSGLAMHRLLRITAFHF